MFKAQSKQTKTKNKTTFEACGPESLDFIAPLPPFLQLDTAVAVVQLRKPRLREAKQLAIG